VEIQIRTRLQHCWATAVEAIGLVRGEDLKGGEGTGDWLRLFELMAAELALAEGCAEPPDVPPHSNRIYEIRSLNEKLLALPTLENLRHAIRYIDTHTYDYEGGPKCFRIVYDHERKEVRVTPYAMPIRALRAYKHEEFENVKDNSERTNAVFVDADGLGDLKKAYPNYFGDVQLFCWNLERITKGYQAQEYTVPPQPVAPPPPHEAPDLSWFRRFKRWS
jgi:hypothetical protein